MSEVSQQAIADRLQISRATVSRCFTNHSGISPVTRAKVFQVAAEIGYTHMENRRGSGKSPKSSGSVRFDVLICTDREEYFRKDYVSPGEMILAGVSEYAQLHDAQVEVNLIPPSVRGLDHEAFQEIPELLKRGSSGILLIYPFPETVIDQLAIEKPLVSLVDQLEHTSIDCVDVDHYAGISSAVEYLVEQGHKRIGFYTKDYAPEASWSFRRYGAFVEKMTRLRLKVSMRDVVGVFPRRSLALEESIDEAAERTRDGVTAWVCAADHQAYDIIRGFRKRGLTVPKDVSVTGFDGIKRVGRAPALTTIQIPYREIGMIGAERLAARIHRRFHGKQHIYISGQLQGGRTVAAPVS